MNQLPLADLLAGIVGLGLTAYSLLAGADFGGGVWDMLASGPRKDRQRELIADAIAPVWEANHVWLILAVVLLFTCFPSAFARLGIELHIPLTLMLVGIVLRGSAFTFRTYDTRESAGQRRWGRIFASASVLTPVLLGVSIGAVASGRIRGVEQGSFARRFVEPWFTPFALSVGVLALALFAFLAAVYLTVEAKDADLREDFRRRALAGGIAVFAAALVTLVLALGSAPLMWHGLMRAPRAIPVHLLTGVAAVTALLGLWFRRFRLARIAAAAQVSLILWGWMLAQYPYLIPPDLTIAGAAAPRITLQLTLYALGFGAAVLFPSLFYLFKVFKLSR